MNLFENLNIINNYSKLEERNAINVDLYIDFKRALNSNNDLKELMFLNTNVPRCEVDEFSFKLDIHAAILKDVPDWKIDNNFDGNGYLIGYYIINVIDETYKFKEFSSIDNVCNNIASRINDQAEHVSNIIKSGLKNLEKIFNRKNFYYNLTNKVNRDDKWSNNFNLKDENINIVTEDFDKSMPTWLMKAIRQNNTKYGSYGNRYINYPLDTMVWEITAPPISGKLPSDMDTLFACLIDKSGEDHLGQYIIYCPKLYLNNEETIYVNNRNRSISAMSMKALAPFIKEYAVAVNTKEAKQDVKDKKQQRADIAPTNVRHIDSPNNYNYIYGLTYDKSGYVVDPYKYVKKLAALKLDEYINRIEDLYTVLIDAKNSLLNLTSKNNFIPNPKDSFYYADVKYAFDKAYKIYESACSNYKYALKCIDGIKSETDSYRGSPTVNEFNSYVKKCEELVVDFYKIVDEK